MKRSLTPARVILLAIFIAFSLALSVMGIVEEHLKASDTAELQKAKNDLTAVRDTIRNELYTKQGALRQLRDLSELNPQDRRLVYSLAETLESADTNLARIQKGDSQH